MKIYKYTVHLSEEAKVQLVAPSGVNFVFYYAGEQRLSEQPAIRISSCVALTIDDIKKLFKGSYIENIEGDFEFEYLYGIVDNKLKKIKLPPCEIEAIKKYAIVSCIDGVVEYKINNIRYYELNQY